MPAEMDSNDAPIARSDVVEHFSRRVRAAVVDEHDFPRLPAAVERSAQAIVENRDVLFFVEDGNRYGDAGHGID